MMKKRMKNNEKRKRKRKKIRKKEMDEDKREDFFQIKKVKTVPSEISERPVERL
jgi:formylmethanofuran dehydrogenase subunit E